MTRAFRISVAAALLLASVASGALARDQRVSFAPGASSAVLSGRIDGREDATYRLRAKAGQRLTVTLETDNASAYFNVTQSGAAEALFVGSTSGNRFEGALPASGDYEVLVYLMRNAARRGETATYRLRVAIAGAAAVAPAPDFADGLAGGPDWWVVEGVAEGDALNLRAGPASDEPVLARVPNGTALRNLGCRLTGTTRWCQVEANGRLTGWAAGKYLREGPGPGAPVTAPAVEATATGTIPCAAAIGQPTTACRFSVVRVAPGEANFRITLAGGGRRYIHFEAGRPSFTDAQAPIQWQQEADLHLIRIGTERFEIPDAAVNGG